MRVTHSAHFIVLKFNTLTLFAEMYGAHIAPLRNFLQPPVAFSPLGPNIPLNTLLSNTSNQCSFLNVVGQVHDCVREQRDKLPRNL